jgi:hypothetical protein
MLRLQVQQREKALDVVGEIGPSSPPKGITFVNGLPAATTNDGIDVEPSGYG